jgi:hypothetical protein
MIRPNRLRIISLVAARQPERRGEVDADHVVEILVAQLNKQVVPGDPCVGDQDIELSHRLFGGGNQRLDLFHTGEIAGQHMDPLFQFAGERIQRLAPGARNGNRGALCVQRFCNRAADAACRAGDQRGPACQIEHIAPLGEVPGIPA